LARRSCELLLSGDRIRPEETRRTAAGDVWNAAPGDATTDAAPASAPPTDGAVVDAIRVETSMAHDVKLDRCRLERRTKRKE
jgi:hypothetical protein